MVKRLRAFRSARKRGPAPPVPARPSPLDFDDAAAVVEASTLVPKARLESLWEMVRTCEEMGLRGSFVECGVWKGGSVGLMALATLRFAAAPRNLHLFDSFQDICEPDEEIDGDRAVREAREWGHRDGPMTGRLAPVDGFYDQFGGHGTLAECRGLLEKTIGYDPAFVWYHAGWFQDTLPRISPDLGDVAILRLDADWYAATRFCLEQLWHHVVPGGYVIFDDYHTYEGCRRAADEFLSRLDADVPVHEVDGECCYVVVPPPLG